MRIDYYFGCDDMNNHHQDFDRNCEFEINRKKLELLLTFEKIPERDSDSY